MPAERWFRRLLRLFPSDFRGDFGEEMTETFRHQHRDAERGGVAAVTRLWWHTVKGIVATAPREHVDLLKQDLGYGIRMLRRAPAFTAAAILTLALGIGANTAMFTIIDAVLLRPLPFPSPDRLLLVFGSFSGGTSARVSPPDFRDYRERMRTVTGLAAMFPLPYTIAGGSIPERVEGALVTADFFDVLGMAPLAGRSFSPADATEVDRATTVVIGYGLWQRRFGGRADAVGQTMIVNGRGSTVIGVMPAAFAIPPDAELWVPSKMSGPDMEQRAAHFLLPIARLKTGVDVAQAQRESDAIAAALARDYPKTNTSWKLRLTPLRDTLVGDVRQSLLLLATAVGLVLLIACVNVANLLLARAATRSHEIAVRAALGASRLRIVRQLLTESLLLAVAGGAVSLFVASWSLTAVSAIAPPDLAHIAGTTMDLRVLLFTSGLSIATGIIFGLLPALRAMHSLDDALRSPDRSGAPPIRHGVGRLLVGAELALATMLVVGAGLLLRSLVSLGRVDPGFEARQLLSFQVAVPTALDAEAVRRFYGAFVDRLTAIPGVEHAALASEVPLSNQGSDTFFSIAGRPRANPNERPTAYFRRVTADYFATMRLPIERGRAFTPDEVRNERGVVAINQAMARRFFNGDAIGQRLLIERFPGELPYDIVAIVGDMHQDSLDSPPSPEMYIPALTYWTTNVVIRSPLPPTALVPAVRAELAQLDPMVPISKVASFDERVSSSMVVERFRTLLLLLFSTVALGLAAIGVYGMAAYSVSQRTREIGVRMALGAAPSTILRAELASAARLTIAGVAVGMTMAAALLRLLSGLLFKVSGSDPLTLAGSTAVLAAVMLAASYSAARGAARIDPLVALRLEH
jgi:putative ABC transport system permease protein